MPPCIVSRTEAKPAVEKKKNGKSPGRGAQGGGAPKKGKDRRHFKFRNAQNDLVQELNSERQKLAGERDALRELKKQVDEGKATAAEEKENQRLFCELMQKQHIEDSTFKAADASLKSYIQDIEYLDSWISRGYLHGRWLSLMKWALPWILFTLLRVYIWDKMMYSLPIMLSLLRYDMWVLLFMQACYVFSLVLAKGGSKRAGRFVYYNRSSWFYWFCSVCWVNRESITKVDRKFSGWGAGVDFRPRSLAQTEIVDPEARVDMQYHYGKFLRFKLKVIFWGKFYIADFGNPDRCKPIVISPSISLVSQLIHGDICGLNTDPEVARQRIDARLRSIQCVNINRFSAQIDDIYGDTALLALFCWRKRMERRKDFPR
jgi:hypothetical protein